MKTFTWGKNWWQTFHQAGAAFPECPTEEDRHNAASFFRYAGKMLPCQTCRPHFDREMQRNPPEPHTVSRERLQRWLHALHNSVNARLNKPSMPWSEYVTLYQDDCENGMCTAPAPTCPPPRGMIPPIAFAIVLIAVVAMVTSLLVWRSTSSRGVARTWPRTVEPTGGLEKTMRS